MSSNVSRVFWGASCVLTVGCALMATGCVPSPTPKAAESLACDPNAIVIEGNDDQRYTAVATGCGKKDLLYPESGKWASLRERAALDMSCGAGELKVTVDATDVFGAIGCGKKTVYKWRDHGGMAIQSASEIPAPTAAPAPAPAPAPAASAAADSPTASPEPAPVASSSP